MAQIRTVRSLGLFGKTAFCSDGWFSHGKASIRTVRTILSFGPIFLGGRILGEMLSFICTFMCNASLGVVPARFDNARPLRSASTTTTRQKGNIQPVDFFT
jgi:hypothetical protein